MSTRIDIREGGEAEGDDMAAHVQAVGEQRHGVEHQAAGDLDDHHGCGQSDDELGPPLAMAMMLIEVDMRVAEFELTVEMHGVVLRWVSASTDPAGP
jgi:hypothetical protein